MAAGVLPPLVALLDEGSPRVKFIAAYTLADLALEVELREEILEWGALPPLVQLLGVEAFSTGATSAGVIARLAQSTGLRMRLVEGGVVGPLVKLLTDGTPGELENAAAALSWLGHSSSAIQVRGLS